MSHIGINEYAIGVIQNGGDCWYYFEDNKKPRVSSALEDAKRYDDLDRLRNDLEVLQVAFAYSYKILEIQRCPKCHKEFTDYPSISREDNKTEICPSCGVREAMDAYLKVHGVEAD